MNRRGFVAGLLRTGGAMTIGGVIWGGLVRQTRSAPLALRPPGAVPEREFLRRCIRCGLCVAACPYETLRLATPGESHPVGMPGFVPRDVPCYLCEDLPCVAACPSGALDPESVRSPAGDAGALDYHRARMGLAVVDEESCIAFWGIQCDACYRVCPLLDSAVTLEFERNERTGMHARLTPLVHADACTGCGLCERACVTEKAAIFVLPLEVAQGRPGERYIRGWDRLDERRLHEASDDVTTRNERSRRDPLDYLNSDDNPGHDDLDRP